MFDNEVLIEKSDKEKIIKLINEINEILEKYPYQNQFNAANTVTVMSRAKTAVKEAKHNIESLFYM